MDFDCLYSFTENETNLIVIYFAHVVMDDCVRTLDVLPFRL